MKSVFYVLALLCILSVLISIQSFPSGAQKLLPELPGGLPERKALAAQKKTISEAAFQQDIARRKKEAADHKFEPVPQPENVLDAGPEIADPLSQSAKRFREKGVEVRNDLGRSMAMVQAFDTLREKAVSQGSVRVIVGLRADYQPEGNLAKAADVAQQRARIASVQEALVQKAPGIVAGSLKRFEFIPYLAFETNAAGVDHLRASEDVVSITEDTPLPATL